MRTFSFDEFETTAGTVRVPTITTADDMSPEESSATRTDVGDGGVVLGSLQSASGGKVEVAGRPSMVVDFYFHVRAGTANFDDIVNGDQLVVGGKTYEIVHREDETGAGLAPVLFLRLTE